MQEWIELLQAAGFDPSKMNHMQAYELSGHIIHDSILTAKKNQLARATGRIPLGTTCRLVSEMTPAEKVQLRERVSRS